MYALLPRWRSFVRIAPACIKYYYTFEYFVHFDKVRIVLAWEGGMPLNFGSMATVTQMEINQKTHSWNSFLSRSCQRKRDSLYFAYFIFHFISFLCQSSAFCKSILLYLRLDLIKNFNRISPTYTIFSSFKINQII